MRAFTFLRTTTVRFRWGSTQWLRRTRSTSTFAATSCESLSRSCESLSRWESLKSRKYHRVSSTPTSWRNPLVRMRSVSTGTLWWTWVEWDWGFVFLFFAFEWTCLVSVLKAVHIIEILGFEIWALTSRFKTWDSGLWYLKFDSGFWCLNFEVEIKHLRFCFCQFEFWSRDSRLEILVFIFELWSRDEILDGNKRYCCAVGLPYFTMPMIDWWTSQTALVSAAMWW